MTTDKRERLRPEAREHQAFERAFGLDLEPFVHPLLGLDAIALDDAILTPDGHSTGSWIAANTDDATTAYVKGLI